MCVPEDFEIFYELKIHTLLVHVHLHFLATQYSPGLVWPVWLVKAAFYAIAEEFGIFNNFTHS